MVRDEHLIHVVDDDAHFRESVEDLLQSLGYTVRLYATVGEFLAASRPAVPSCLILDLEMPDVGGLDLQLKLAGTEHPPIVFITAHGDISTSVRAMKLGAVDFLTKPFNDTVFEAAVAAALERDRKQLHQRAERAALARRLATLSPRERQVLPLIVSGMPNKQGAAALGISEVTFQIHRGKIMKKMEAKSFADLVKCAYQLGIGAVD